MIVVICIRIPRLFSDRWHRLLRDESLEHWVDCDTHRCLSTDSLSRAQSFSFLSFISDPVKFERRSLRGENQETRRLSGRSIQDVTERMHG